VTNHSGKITGMLRESSEVGASFVGYVL